MQLEIGYVFTMIKSPRIDMIALLCFVVACNGVHHLDQDSGALEFKKNRSICFSDLSKLTHYSAPKSCREAGIVPTKVSNSLLMGVFRDSSFGVFFIENTGKLELLFGYDDIDLSRINVFGPGVVLVNGHVCQKEAGQLHCPAEALKQKQ